MKNLTKVVSLWLVKLIPLMFVSSLAIGQMGLEEIVVTARKIEENLQDAPLSIQAFSNQGLESRAITDVSQIGEFTPNMKFDRAAAIGGSNSTAVVYIRGIGQESGLPTIDQGVGMYIDGVYMARAVGSVVDLVDVERIEVIRGPQGTLFGRNTIGGAVSLTTIKPTEDFYTNISAGVGSDNLGELKLTVNGALSDNVFGMLSVLGKQRDGYVLRSDGTDFGDEDVQSARVALRFAPTDRLLIDLNADVTSSSSNGAPFELVDVNRFSPFVTVHNAFIAPPTAGCFTPTTGSTTSTDSACYNEKDVLGLDRDNGGLAPKDELDAYGLAATIQYDISDRLTFKSITGYRDTESEFNLDQDHSPVVVAEVESASQQDQFTQEFQLLGNHDNFNYVLGAYYFQENARYIETVTFSPVFFTSGGDNDNDSQALFGQFSYNITDALDLTLGVRYTDETKRFTPDSYILEDVTVPVLPFIPAGTPILPPVTEEITVSKTTPMANLSYNWNDEFMTYLTYSEGFKSGGFTQRVFPPQGTVPSFKPEFADVVELGFKWQSSDNRLRFNGAFFTTDYEDLQIVSQANTVAPIVQNAGKAEINGVELDLQAVPADDWLLEASLGYLDANYTQVDAGTGITTANELVKAPELSAAAALAYTFYLDSGATFSPRVDYTYSDEFYNNAINSSFLKQDSYGLINLSLNYTDSQEVWEILVYGKNLNDERYISAGYSEQNGPTLNLGTSEVVRNRGREFGVQVKYHID